MVAQLPVSPSPGSVPRRDLAGRRHSSWDRLSQSRKKHALTLLSVSWLSALVLLTLAPQGPFLDAEGRSTYHLLNLRPFSDIADTTPTPDEKVRHPERR